MQRVSSDRKQIVIDWLEIPAGEPSEDEKSLRKRLHLTGATFGIIRREWKYQNEYNARKDREVRKVQHILEKGLGGDTPPIEVTIGGRRAKEKLDPNEIFDEPQMPESEEEQVKEVLDALWNMSVARKNVFASKIWLQAKGQLVEKREDKVTFVNADDIARQHLEAERQLREGGYRMAHVSEKRPLLSDPTRPDNQQEHGKDSKVGTVGLST